MGVVTTGRPAAIASNCVSANPSDNVGSTNTSASAHRRAACARVTRPITFTLSGADATAASEMPIRPATTKRISVPDNCRAASNRYGIPFRRMTCPSHSTVSG